MANAERTQTLDLSLVLQKVEGVKADLDTRFDEVFTSFFDVKISPNTLDLIETFMYGTAEAGASRKLIIIYSNHQSYADGYGLGIALEESVNLVKRLNGEAPADAIFPIATDMTSGKDGTFAKATHAFFEPFLNRKHVFTHRIIRPDKLRKGIKYTPEEKAEHRKSMELLDTAADNGNIVAVCPAGTMEEGRIHFTDPRYAPFIQKTFGPLLSSMEKGRQLASVWWAKVGRIKGMRKGIDTNFAKKIAAYIAEGTEIMFVPVGFEDTNRALDPNLRVPTREFFATFLHNLILPDQPNHLASLSIGTPFTQKYLLNKLAVDQSSSQPLEYKSLSRRAADINLFLMSEVAVLLSDEAAGEFASKNG